MNNQKKNNSTLVIYYLTLRAFLGYLGILLPIILFFGAWIIFGTKLQSSISAYYHTKMGDVLVGSLFAFGVFLFSYKGWDKDYILARFGCVFAIGVALFPTNAEGAPFTFVTLLHYIFTVAFFGILIYFCLKLFVKSDQEKPYSPKKRLRNRIYRVCGWVMIICMVGIGINFIPGAKERLGGSLVFFMETFAIWAFGISWFTKGETLKYLRD
jgi:uncharacterized membrane protein